MNMKKEQTLGIIRHLISVICGILLYKGAITENEAMEISSLVGSLAVVIWSVLEKNKLIENGKG